MLFIHCSTFFFAGSSFFALILKNCSCLEFFTICLILTHLLPCSLLRHLYAYSSHVLLSLTFLPIPGSEFLTVTGNLCISFPLAISRILSPKVNLFYASPPAILILTSNHLKRYIFPHTLHLTRYLLLILLYLCVCQCLLFSHTLFVVTDNSDVHHFPCWLL